MNFPLTTRGCTSGMRKSCEFCRIRKIKCSGQRICSACRARSIDCIYQQEGCKGRPRSDRPKQYRHRHSSTESSLTTQPSDEVFAASLAFPSPDINGSIQGGALLGHELESTFTENFGGEDALFPFHLHIASGQNIEWPDKPAAPAALGNQPLVSPLFFQSATVGESVPIMVSYDQLFISINNALVELVSTSFGSLGCISSFHPGARYIANKLALDTTQSMFDGTNHSTCQSTASLHGDEHYLRQMIDLWFTHHPLSFMLSKTLLLHRLRNKDIDKPLLYCIIADANYMLGEQKSEAAFQYFTSSSELLRNRSLLTTSLSTIQSLILLGWRELCLGSVRRGKCYLEVAGQLVREMQERVPGSDSAAADYINGVAIFEVEQELLLHIHRFMFSVGLWIAMQLNTPLCGSLLSIDLISLDSSESSVLALDRESGNVTSLKIQEELFKQLSSMYHISLTIYQIHALHHHISAGSDNSLNQNNSTSLTQTHEHFSSACGTCFLCSLYQMITNRISELQIIHSPLSSHEVTLISFRTILLQLLFPKPISCDTQPSLAANIFEAAIQNIAYCRDLLFSTEGTLLEMEVFSRPRKSNGEIVLSAVDTCSRALGYIIDMFFHGPMEVRQIVLSNRYDIIELIRFFMWASEHPRLQVVLGARTVQNRIEAVNAKFLSLEKAASSTFEAPQLSMQNQSEDIFDFLGISSGVSQ